MRTSSTPSPPPSGWGLQGPQPRRAFSTALSNDHCHYFQVDILNLTVVVFFITVILPQQLNHLFISLDPSFFLYWGVISSQSLNNRNIKFQYLGYEYILCHPIAQLITFMKYFTRYSRHSILTLIFGSWLDFPMALVTRSFPMWVVFRSTLIDRQNSIVLLFWLHFVINIANFDKFDLRKPQELAESWT